MEKWSYVPEKVTDFWVFGPILMEGKGGTDVRYQFGPGVKSYVQSFYWSCMTALALGEQVRPAQRRRTGTVQPSPENTAETVFELVDTLLGTAVFSAILGTVGILVGNCNRRQSERRSLMDTLKKLMDFRSGRAGE